MSENASPRPNLGTLVLVGLLAGILTVIVILFVT
jgi:hypothetical protein